MTYFEFIKYISDPLNVTLFPASGNLYYNHIRVGYLDFTRHSEEQKVCYFKPASILPSSLVEHHQEEEKKLRDIIKQLTALAVIYNIEIKSTPR